MESLRDLFGFLWQKKLFWLFPLVLAMLLFAVLIGLTSGSAIAPFIYAIF
jgi:hypothetical protein